jgi:hypothetical protein
MQQLGHIRKSHHVPRTSSSPEPELALPPPRARRPVIDPNASPPVGRIARPPTVSGIFEEEEEEEEEYLQEDNLHSSPTPPRRQSKSWPSSSGASSSSGLPLPTRSSTPHFNESTHLDFDEELSRAGKRKPTRRQSGLLTTSMSITTMTPKGYKTEVLSPRPPSPAFGSPLRRDAALEEEEEEIRMAAGIEEAAGDDEVEEPLLVAVTRRKRKSKDKKSDLDGEPEEAVKKEREKRKARDRDDIVVPSSYEGKKPKLKDVTNSPPPRPSLATIDSHGK